MVVPKTAKQKAELKKIESLYNSIDDSPDITIVSL